ncbi:MAG TPA: dioxygenase [Blastococcus sp.]|jgi:protocatechuate 3,4-dioxygenase beta subunit|nr:dioxygenase [Blastococcus sp.]
MTQELTHSQASAPIDGQSDFIEDLESLTPTVLASYSRIEDERLRELVTSAIAHLHAYVKEVNLTNAEWRQALDFFNALGRNAGPKSNPAMALSDLLGVSTLVCLLEDTATTGGALHTASSVLGPVWREGAPFVESGGSLLRSETPGAPLFFTGRVLDPSGNPLPDVTVHVWQATPDGLYENQDDEQEEMNLRARFTTDADGTFQFRSVLPGGYPIPDREPLGSMLRLAKRPAWRPAHIHFMLHREGLRTLVTQIFHPLDPHLHQDAAFGATRDLMMGGFEEHTGPAPEPGIEGTWYTAEETFVMVPGESIVPAAPIE